MSKFDIIGLGAMNMDHLYQVERILPDGESAIGGHELQPGGSAANTIYALGRLGIHTGFAGVIGSDRHGKALVRALAEAGVDTRRIRAKSDRETGSALCFFDTQGKRSLYVLPGANNTLVTADIDLKYMGRARWLHTSSFAGDEQLEVQKWLLGSLPPAVKVSFAPGTLYAARGMKQLAPLLRRTNLLFINEAELRRLTRKDARPGAERCLKAGCDIVVVTSGRGAIRLSATEQPPAVCYIIQGNPRKEFIVTPDSERARVVDTTGAGDAFAAGFLFGLLQQKPLPACGVLGDVMARFCIAEKGARKGLPDAAQLDAAYRKRRGLE